MSLSGQRRSTAIGIAHESSMRDLGVPRMGLVFLAIVAAGIDVRTRDLGLGGPASNPLELVLLLAMLVTLADLVIVPRQLPLMISNSWRVNPWLTTYFGWCFIAGVVGVMQFALSLFVFRNLLPAFVFFIFLAHSVRTAEDLKRILICFLAAAIPNVAIGLSQRAFGKPFPVAMNAASAVKMDLDGSFVAVVVSGLFNHPNGLSIFLLPVVLVAFGLTCSRIKLGWPLRGAVLLMFFASLALIYFTRAKGSWAWVAFGMVLWMIPRRMLTFRGGWIACVLVVVFAIATITIVSLNLGGALRTMNTRVLLWYATLAAVSESPFLALFGSGQQLVWNASARLADLQYANAHNVFLNQIVYFGIPAAILYVGSFVSAIKSGQAALRAAPESELGALGRLAMITLMSMAGQYFFEPAAESSGLAVACFLFMGVAATSHVLLKKSIGERSGIQDQHQS